jgi:uncharacterized protein YhaN
MRLRRLDLARFGHFTDHSLDFGAAGASDFHVVYGPNEAGKTTLMEAFLRLLYGFPHRDPYDFQHQRKNLRVSARIDLPDGSQDLIRRPTRSADLTDAAGNPVPEQTLAAHLGGLALEDYRQLLCLDDDTIERGGESIVSSKGDIGELLFSAAAGISDLGAVLDEARAEADALHRKRASNTAVAQLKKALQEVSTQIREADISAARYRQLKQDLEAAQAQEAALRQQRTDLGTRREALRTRIAALPMMIEHDALSARIAPHAAYPENPPLTAADLDALLMRQSSAGTKAADLATRIARIEDAVQAVTLTEAHLHLAEELAALDDLRGRDRGARQDLCRREAELADIMADMAALARDLGAAPDCDPLRLVPGPAAIDALSEALDHMRLTAAEGTRLETDLAEIEGRVAQAKGTLDGLRGPGAADTRIGPILARYGIDRLAPQVAAAHSAIAAAQTAADTALDALLPGGDAPKTLPPCPLPPGAAEALQTDWAAACTACDTAKTALDDAREQAALLRDQAERLRHSDGPLDDDTAQALRDRRDALWQDHVHALTPDSAAAFKAALDDTDAMADRRIAFAATLGQMREVDAQHHAATTRQGLAETRLADATAKRGALSERIARLAIACGLPEDSPVGALVDWSARHATAQAAQDTLRRCRAEHQPALAKAEALTAELAPLLDLHAPGFDEVIATARDMAEAARSQGEALRRAEASLAELQADHARRHAALERARAVAEGAAQAWQDAVTGSLDAPVDPARLAASGLALLHRLRELETDRARLARQIATMKADRAAFADSMTALAARYAPGADPTDPQAQFGHLADLARAAEAAQAETLRLTDARNDALAEAETARQEIAEIESRIATIGAGFDPSIPTATLPDLRAALGLTEETNAGRTRRAQVAAQLCQTLGVATVDQARVALGDASLDALKVEAAALDTDLERLGPALDSAIETRSRADRDLAAVTGDASIARLTERQTTLELELEDALLSHARLHFGHRLASEAIRRYRDAHRSQMMQATERAFGELTGGAYQSLRAEPDGAREILVALDAEGRAKQAQDMSKGTRFQLYLALRAAAYEQLVETGLRLPFFCDDIFETFDEDRTRAACAVMARIGRMGQAIYLTHHAHVVALAQEVCGDAVRVHHLTR